VSMGKSTVEFISKGLIPLGPKKITRMSNNPDRERYLIYLPSELNDLWREVHESGKKIKIYIEISSRFFLAMTKFKDSERYKHGFKPWFNKGELKKSFKGGIVFISDMGDIFSSGVKDEWIKAVIEHIRMFPDTYFLFLTRNPERYKDFSDMMPPNAILGSTIETNKDDLYHERRISYVPLPSSSYKE